jgi:hypothetical protein
MEKLEITHHRPMGPHLLYYHYAGERDREPYSPAHAADLGPAPILIAGRALTKTQPICSLLPLCRHADVADLEPGELPQ